MESSHCIEPSIETLKASAEAVSRLCLVSVLGDPNYYLPRHVNPDDFPDTEQETAENYTPRHAALVKIRTAQIHQDNIQSADAPGGSWFWDEVDDWENNNPNH